MRLRPSPRARGGARRAWRPPTSIRRSHLRHLRLHFNLLLSPIYLWGVVLAGGGLADARVWLGFLAVHVFLYGGATAFNSYYDRDEGPVGGMLAPPPVDDALLPFSLVVQGLGVPLAAVVGAGFLLAWLLLCAVFTAYSHPWVRLKAHPASALAAIALGQGGVGFALGWLAARGPAPGAEAVLGAVAAALVVTGLYIVSQSYQTAEDRSRGDRTLPVLLGPRRALGVALAALAPGGALVVVLLEPRAGGPLAAGVAVLFGLVGWWVLRWAARFDEAQLVRNYRTAMRVALVSSGGLTVALLALLLRQG